MSIEEYERLNHSVWECKYHVVFIPKYRKKSFFGVLRTQVGPILRRLARQKGCEILEGHIMPDHVHMLISIPPKYAVSSIVGYIKGKSAIAIARQFRGRERNFTGEKFWARGYFVSTVGRDEEVIRNYIKNQEREDIQQDQLPLFNC
jgi:putative transposase